MKLSRLYSNKPEIFPKIDFRGGLNVVLGEIRLPENKVLDTHNLGKTTLSEVIDFCLLKAKHKDFFLFAHREFIDFVFFLEIETISNGWVTVRRAVAKGSKASFILQNEGRGDCSRIGEEKWNHWDVPFARSVQLLDGYLGLQDISPWSFRDVLGYCLRGQGDYDEPFHLSKFKGRHSEWKPLLAQVLGLDSKAVSVVYDLLDTIDERKRVQQAMVARLPLNAVSVDQVAGLIAIAEKDAGSIRRALDTYDFELADADINKELVEELDLAISSLNQERYYLGSMRGRLVDSLGAAPNVDFDGIDLLYREAGVALGDQIKKSFEELNQFHKAITEERREHLAKQMAGADIRLREIDSELRTLNRRRAGALVRLKDTETFSKFKLLSEQLAGKLAYVNALHAQRSSVEELARIEDEIQGLAVRLEAARGELRQSIDRPSDLYTDIRARFSEIMSGVIGRNANLYTQINSVGNIEFRAQILGEDDASVSAAGRGHSYRHLLCVAFDMAVHGARSKSAYPRFVYHDGVFASLDDRKKHELMKTIRRYCEDGLQHIVTVIDSELPKDGKLFERDEVVLMLHDEGDQGRLFKMPKW